MRLDAPRETITTSAAAPALQSQGLRKSFPARSGALEVLRNVELSLPACSAAVIMGPSGCGKSTLLNILGALEAPTAGRVMVGGVEPFSLPADELARFRNRHIGFVFQEHHLLPQLCAAENVVLPALARHPGPRPLADPMSRAHELLERVGLKHRWDHFPGELSGGERQRVAVARALLMRPAVVLADEPTGNLDRAAAESIGGLLAELPARHETALLLVTHSEQLAQRFSTRYVLQDGVLEPRAG